MSSRRMIPGLMIRRPVIRRWMTSGRMVSGGTSADRTTNHMRSAWTHRMACPTPGRPRTGLPSPGSRITRTVGTARRGLVGTDDRADGADPAAGGYGSAGADPAAGGYGSAGADPAAGGYGAAGPYRPADDLAGQREEAAGHSSDGAPGPGERPERDGQLAQQAGLLAGEAPWAGAQDVTAATAEVREEAVPAEDASREVSGWNEDVPDESGPAEDVRDESGDDEDVHAGGRRARRRRARRGRAPGDVRGRDGPQRGNARAERAAR